MNHLEEIRARLNIEELVGGYVQLKKAGRNLRGLCPFHSEKTPSFMVSPEKGIAYCFGCHQGGDIFKFIQLIESVDFGEAVKILAQKTNITLPQSLPREHSKRLKGIEINQWTAKFYELQLENHPQHKEYFLNRGLTESTIKHFQLGFAPDSFDKLKNHLLSKNFDARELVDAAVASKRSIADENIYDRFRNRLIFPIFDHQANPVAFSGRIIGEGEPKYLNSPDTSTYNKSLILYGLNWAKDSIKKEDRAIFVEGYMDVIAAHQAGTVFTVATCGTALTPQQLKLIARYTKNIAFAFDQDSAGLEATIRGIELAQLTDVKVKIIRIPEGKDPDECIQKNPEAWISAVENPISVMDFYFDYAFVKFNREEIEGKKEILNFLLPIIKLYKSEMEKGEYLNRLALAIKTDVRLLWEDLKNVQNKSYRSPKKEEVISQPQKRIFSREEYLLGFIFNHPDVYEDVAKNLINNIPVDPKTEVFYNALKNVYTRESSLNIDLAREELSQENQENVGIYSLLIEEAYPDFSEDLTKKEVRMLVQGINRKNVRNIQKDYEFKIREAGNNEEKRQILSKYNDILKLTARI